MDISGGNYRESPNIRLLGMQEVHKLTLKQISNQLFNQDLGDKRAHQQP